MSAKGPAGVRSWERRLHATSRSATGGNRRRGAQGQHSGEPMMVSVSVGMGICGALLGK